MARRASKSQTITAVVIVVRQGPSHSAGAAGRVGGYQPRNSSDINGVATQHQPTVGFLSASQR